MFCGHRECAQDARVDLKLRLVVEKLINAGASEFLFGGYGMFDSMAARAVLRAKKEHPAVSSTLVLAYPTQRFDAALYDQTLYPPLEHIPPRFAVIARNRYMVERSDLVVAYVLYSWGGAAKTLEYAKRCGKELIMLT